MNETLAFLVVIVPALVTAMGVGTTFWLTRRRQPAEIKAIEANAAKTTADAIGAMQATIANLMLTQSQQIGVVSDLRAQIGAAHQEIAVLKSAQTVLHAELVASRAETAKALEHARVLEIAVNGFPAEIERLEKLVAMQQAQAAQAASTNQADANARENVSRAALANPSADMGGGAAPAAADKQKVAVRVEAELIEPPQEPS